MSLDPAWASVGVAVVYVVFTLFIVLESRKSRDTIWDLEKKRMENKKMAIRRIIVGELDTNKLILSEIRNNLEKYKSHKVLEELPLIEFPETTAYEGNIRDLGILEKEELDAIRHLYKTFNKIKVNYLEIRRDAEIRDDAKNRESKKPNKNIDDLIDKTTEIVAHTMHFCEELDDGYKLLEGKIPKKEKIDIETLKKILENILESYKNSLERVGKEED